MINFQNQSHEFFAEASARTQSSAQAVLEFISSGFSISSFREKEPLIWSAIIKPSEYIAEKFNLRFEYVLIGNGHVSDFHATTLNIEPPQIEIGRVDSKICFVSGSSNNLIPHCIQHSMISGKILVPFQVEHLKGTHSELDRRSMLESTLRQHLWLKDVFDDSEPIIDQSEFFGRDLVVSKLIGKISAGSPVGVFGLRKVGKSSVLSRLRHVLSQDKSSVNLISFNQANSASVKSGRWWNLASDQITQLCKSLASQIQASGLVFDAPKPKCPEMVKNGMVSSEQLFSDALTKDLTVLVSAMGALALRVGKRRGTITLLIDEIDHCLPIREDSKWWSNDYFTYWNTIQSIKRGLTEPATFSYVVCGVNPICVEAGAMKDQPNPLFEVTPIYLGPMSEVECFQMLNGLGTKVGIYFPYDGIRDLMQSVGGFPWLMRKAASKIHNANTERESVLEVGSAIASSTIQTGRSSFIAHLDWMLKHLKDTCEFEYKLISDIAIGGNEKYTTKWKDVAFRDAYADHLQKYGLLRIKDGIPTITIGLIASCFSGPATDGISDQKTKLLSLIEDVEMAIRGKIVRELSGARSPEQTIDAILQPMPSDPKNRGKTKPELKQIALTSGIRSMLGYCNWGDYVFVLEAHHDNMTWYGTDMTKEARMKIIRSKIDFIHTVRHNNDHALGQAISNEGYDAVYRGIYQIGEMIAG